MLIASSTTSESSEISISNNLWTVNSPPAQKADRKMNCITNDLSENNMVDACNYFIKKSQKKRIKGNIHEFNHVGMF